MGIWAIGRPRGIHCRERCSGIGRTDDTFVREGITRAFVNAAKASESRGGIRGAKHSLNQRR
jgi:hypothetical protein